MRYDQLLKLLPLFMVIIGGVGTYFRLENQVTNLEIKLNYLSQELDEDVTHLEEHINKLESST